MRWFRLDVTFPDHPKVTAVGGDAAWLHVCAIAYCNRNETDGHVPQAILSRLSDRRNPRKLATDLVRVGLWIETTSGWEIHDYLSYNDSREKIEGDREAARQRMKRARASRKRSPEQSENFAGSSPNYTTPHNTTQKTPPPTQHQAGSAPALGSGGGASFANTVALTVADRLADREPAGKIANRAAWTFKVAQRLLTEQAEVLADLGRTPGQTPLTAADVIFARCTGQALPPDDSEYAKAGAGYGRAVAQAQLDGDLVDRAAFLDEIAGRPQAWQQAATAAYDEALNAVPLDERCEGTVLPFARGAAQTRRQS